MMKNRKTDLLKIVTMSKIVNILTKKTGNGGKPAKTTNLKRERVLRELFIELPADRDLRSIIKKYKNKE
jgi:hypothetical protein